MENPWKNLPLSSPYVLPLDNEIVQDANKEFKALHQIRYNVLPEPYLGNPNAPIILLNLNPGYAEEDIHFYQQERAQELWRKNISHEPMDYPFWLIDPSLDKNILLGIFLS